VGKRSWIPTKPLSRRLNLRSVSSAPRFFSTPAPSPQRQPHQHPRCRCSRTITSPPPPPYRDQGLHCRHSRTITIATAAVPAPSPRPRPRRHPHRGHGRTSTPHCCRSRVCSGFRPCVKCRATSRPKSSTINQGEPNQGTTSFSTAGPSVLSSSPCASFYYYFLTRVDAQLDLIPLDRLMNTSPSHLSKTRTNFRCTAVSQRITSTGACSTPSVLVRLVLCPSPCYIRVVLTMLWVGYGPALYPLLARLEPGNPHDTDRCTPSLMAEPFCYLYRCSPSAPAPLYVGLLQWWWPQAPSLPPQSRHHRRGGGRRVNTIASTGAPAPSPSQWPRQHRNRVRGHTTTLTTTPVVPALLQRRLRQHLTTAAAVAAPSSLQASQLTSRMVSINLLCFSLRW
jgi:hypothetical protein